MDLPPIERLQALHVEPGDALVVGIPEGTRINPDQVETWRGLFEKALPGTPVIFAVGDVELSVVRSEP